VSGVVIVKATSLSIQIFSQYNGLNYCPQTVIYVVGFIDRFCTLVVVFFVRIFCEIILVIGTQVTTGFRSNIPIHVVVLIEHLTER